MDKPDWSIPLLMVTGKPDIPVEPNSVWRDRRERLSLEWGRIHHDWKPILGLGWHDRRRFVFLPRQRVHLVAGNVATLPQVPGGSLDILPPCKVAQHLRVNRDVRKERETSRSEWIR
jgi:hypothetical protein